MFMTINSNSIAKYHLTTSIRYLQVLLKYVIDKKFYSEVVYWIDSLEMIRDCLYDYNDHRNTMEMQKAIREIQSELTNAYAFVKDSIDEVQLSHVSNAWLNVKKAGDSLE